jgi:hypothetical protein
MAAGIYHVRIIPFISGKEPKVLKEIQELSSLMSYHFSSTTLSIF